MRIGFTKKKQIKQKHTLCEIPVNNYMPFPSLEWEEVLYESPECSFEIRKYEIWNSNLVREFLMHQFFLRRGFCAETMVFKFVYFKIFNNETDMHSLFVNNLFELRVEQRKTCYYRIRSVSALLLPYITDSICFALFFFHTIWIVLHIHVPSVYINVHFYLSIFYVKLNRRICQVSINVINLLRLGFKFV